MAEPSEYALRVRVAKDNLRRVVNNSAVPVIARAFPVLATLGAGYFIGKKRMVPNLLYIALMNSLSRSLPGRRTRD